MTTDQILHVDPADLRVGTNVRTNLPDDPDFTRSIRERGVLEVITCTRDADGGLLVLRGQRRARTAAAVGLTSVPVRVVDDPDQADRIVDQLTENVHRAAMAGGEVREAVHQLALIGVPVHQIARRTAIPRETVDTALKVAADERATMAMDGHELTLDQAALWAEWADDVDALHELDAILERGATPTAHDAQRLRDGAETRRAVRARTEERRADGYPVAEPWEHFEWGQRLADKVDKTTGQPIDDDTAHLVPTAVLKIRPRSQWERERDDDASLWAEEWYATDLDAAGVIDKWAWRGDQTGPDDGADAARAAREQAAAEEAAARAEREAAWESAGKVRRQWMAEFATARTSPRGAERVIARTLMGTAVEGGWMLLEPHEDLVDVVDGFGDVDTIPLGRAILGTLVACMAAWERDYGRTCPQIINGTSRAWLASLAEWGYTLADVEQALVDQYDNTSHDDEAVDDDESGEG